MSGIFNAGIFNNAVFNTGGAAPPVQQPVVKTGTGGIDPEYRRRKIYKPTGLLERRPQNIPSVPNKNIPTVEARIEDIRDIHEEVTRKLAREFVTPIETMSPVEIDREIAVLMREKLQKDEEEETMLIMMMALHD